MASASTISSSSGTDVASAGGSPKVQYLVTGLLAILSLSLVIPLVSLGRWMLGNDYYQHTPLLVVLAAALAAFRLKQGKPNVVYVLSLRVLIWLCLATGLTVAVFVLPSRWSATLAMLAVLAAATNFVGGRPMAKTLLGPWLMLWAAIPLPVHFDNWFVVALQQLATWLASVWLELGNVMHLTTGVAIQTEGQEYFVKDACSGIHSVFAAVAVGVGYGAIRNYGLGRLFLVVSQLLIWVVVANALRVFLTVFGQSRWGLDLSNPAYHEVLGMLTFAGGVLLAISGDHFLRYLRPVEERSGVAVGQASVQRLNNHLQWIDRPLSLRVAVIAVAVMAITGVIFGGAFFKFQLNPKSQYTIQDLAHNSLVDFDQVDAAFLPETIGTWQQVGFRVDKRDEDSVFGGLLSFVWKYSNGSRDVYISIDGPYENWHDLAVCYSGIGWTVSEMKEIEKSIASANVSACELKLYRRPIDYGQVLFGCFDQEAEDLPPPPFIGMAFRHFVSRFRIGMIDRTEAVGGVVQLQVYVDQPGRLTEQQQEENRKLFWQTVEAAFSKKIAEKHQLPGA